MISLHYKVWFGALLMFAAWMMPYSRVLAGPTSAATGVATAGDRQEHPPQCNMLDRYYFRMLPGVVSNCYARRKWEQGHYEAGLERFKRAASWGSKDAQYALGLIYYTGRHVPTDKALGIAWLKLAAERNDPQKVMVAKSAERLASAEQKRQADRLLASMRKRYADKVAASRAWAHYQHALLSSRTESMRGVMPGCQSLSAGGNHIQNAVNYAAELKCWRQEANERRVEGERESLVDQYFSGWIGTVTVRPLQTVPAPKKEKKGGGGN